MSLGRTVPGGTSFQDYGAQRRFGIVVDGIGLAGLFVSRELGGDKRILACIIYRAGVLNFTGPVREALSLAAAALGRECVETLKDGRRAGQTRFHMKPCWANW